MIDAWSDLDAIRSVLIAVSTFGQVPHEGMDKYMSALKRNRRYDLSVLSMPAHNPFKNISRNTDYILLNFTDNRRLYESPWDSVFLHRKVLVVIGLVHCPSNPDLDVAHQEFLSAMKKFPHAIMKRCLAFEPLDSQQDIMERQDLVMVPNADTKRLQFYMNTLIMDVVERLLCEMMEAAKALSSSQELPYIPHDKPIVQDAAKKKRFLPGRISKVTADYSLLCGIVADAKELYNSSIEATKSAGDLVWRGAALEGLACCDPDASYEDRIALMEKAIRNYERRADTESLRLEAFMKLSRFAASQNHPVDSTDYLSRAFELCGSVPAKDRISVFIESAILSHSQGAKRKFGMFIREAALLNAQKERWHDSFSLSLLCSSVYGLEGSISACTWNSLQTRLLQELIASARATNRLSHACTYMARLLIKVRSSIRQRDITAELSKTVPLVPKTQNISMPGIPQITVVELIPLDEHAIPKSRKPQNPKEVQPMPKEDEDVFLFRPSASSPNVQSKSVTTLNISIGQLLHMDVAVRNPLLIELPISSISAQCDGADYESFPLSFQLEPLQEKTIRIPILPLSVGSLVLKNVLIRAYGIDTYHPVDRLWKEPVAFQICAPLPLLKVEIDGEYRGYFGQTLTVPFLLRNVGEVAARDVNVNSENFDSSSAKLKLSYNSNYDLEPGRATTVNAVIDCSVKNIGSCRIRIAYAAEMSSEMFREFTFQLPVTIDSGLSVRSFEVRPYAQCQFSDERFAEKDGLPGLISLGPDDCVIVCEVANSADSRFSVNVPGYTKLKYEVEGKSSERIIFPFRRRSFGAESEECIARLVNCPDVDGSSVEGYVQCRKYLIDELVLKWMNCSKPFIAGVITVPGSLVTPSHFRYIIPDPFFFQFELNGSHGHDQSLGDTIPTALSCPVSPAYHSPGSRPDANFFIADGYHKSFPRGQFVTIRVVLSVRRSPMKMSVCVRPSYQDSSGQFDYDLKHRLLWKGSWDHDLDFDQPNSSANLDLSICFVALGKFMFELICKCEQPGSLPIVYYCSLPLLIVTFDKNDSD